MTHSIEQLTSCSARELWGAIATRAGKEDGPYKVDQFLKKNAELFIHIAQKIGRGESHIPALQRASKFLGTAAQATILTKILGSSSSFFNAVDNVVSSKGSGDLAPLTFVHDTLEFASDVVILGALIGVNKLFSVVKVMDLTNSVIEFYTNWSKYEENDAKIAGYDENLTYHLGDRANFEHPVVRAENPHEMKTVYMLKLASKVLSVASGIIAVVGMLTNMVLVSSTALLGISILGTLLAFSANVYKDVSSHQMYEVHAKALV
ncbi:MAG: hypothetical protein COT84_08305 [Chlamydiae bacterium CG10_big_fil_rev_8_21_14_0_10_35_9]|nr:MAG: hypothetical protein COT84_08305 [Chlamydiae bacterium CG10_big_fil_rev_8_21_14_0_10_35_9]